MNELITTQINSVDIALRGADGYVNATAMCQACSRHLGHYLALKRSKDFVSGLERSVGIPTDLLVVIKNDGRNEERGTWIHPRIAWRLAMWCSTEVELGVTAMLENWRLNPGPKIPDDLPGALRLAADCAEEAQKQKVLALAVARRSVEQQVELQAKDAVIELYETRTALLDRLLPDDSNLTYDMKDASDFLGLPKGNITLIALLKHMGYLRDDKRPYEKKENWGLFTCS